MLSKNVIKDIQSLGHKKSRDESNLFVAEGPKIVNELQLLATANIESIYATPEWIEEHAQSGAIEVSEDELKKISFLQTPHQVLAVVRKFEPRIPSGSFILYLDTVQDPGNFGTIIRIADWFGISDVVCSPGCADLYNPKVVQSTMASIARVNVIQDESDDWLSRQSANIYAATLDGTSVYEQKKIASGILIIGNESKGIAEQRLVRATHRITIPRKGRAESLNAAVATGVVLSHLLAR